MKKLIAIAMACALLLGALPVLARPGTGAGVLDRVRTELKQTSNVTFDSHKRLTVRWDRGRVAAGEIVARSSSLLASLRPILWPRRDFRILETKTEMSRFGTVAYSTISLDGFPVIDQYLRLSTASDGSLRSAEISIPAESEGLRVATGRASLTLDQVVVIIRAESRRFDGLIVPDQAQRVWYMTEDGELAPGGRMLLRAADLSRLFEAVVDLRTGRVVRFVDIARR